MGQTSNEVSYKNYPIPTFQEGEYVQVWLDDLDGTERIDALLEEATKVLGDEREFHRVEIESLYRK